MHRVAVLVDDDLGVLGVLGVVDPALSEPQEILLVGLAAVVDAVLVDAHVLSVHVHRTQCRPEAERPEVVLRLANIAAHHGSCPLGRRHG